MNFIYLLVQLSCLTFISGADNENSSFRFSESQPELNIWKVNLPAQQQPGEDPSNLQEVNLNQENMFQETAAYIILYVQKVGEVGSSRTRPQKRNIEKKESIYFWFGKRVSKVLRIETAKQVANLMKQYSKLLPGHIPIRRCVSGWEPEEFQMITRRPYIPTNELYKVKGAMDPAIVKVPLKLREVTNVDSFVLRSSTSVIVFIPPGTNNKESEKARAFGLYLHDRVNREEKEIYFIDCLSNIQKDEETYFEWFLEGINSGLSARKEELLFSLCTNPNNSLLNIMSLWEEDDLFEENRKVAVNKVLYYYDKSRKNIKLQRYGALTNWEEIEEEAEIHTLYVSDEESKDSFIYIGSRSNIKEIEYILHFGEIQSQNWKNLEVVQNSNLPVNFLILFPDCCQT